MGNEIGGPGPKQDPAVPPVVESIEARQESPPIAQGKEPPPDVVEAKPRVEPEPSDSRSGFLSSLNPARLFGRRGGVSTSSTAKPEPQEPQNKESFLDGLMQNVRSGAKKLGQLNDVLANPYVQDGLEVLRESGLNGLALGAQVKKDIESGVIPADMVARLEGGSFRTGDVAFLLGYLRDLAGGTLELNLNNDAARRLLARVQLPAEVKAETLRGVQLGPGDKLILRFSGDPLYDAGLVSLDFNKELELSISGIGDPNATRLTFEAESGTSTEMMFSGWNLEATGNQGIDGVLSFFAKILLAPFLLLAGLFGEAKGARVELEDDNDGSTRLRAEAMGATLTDERLTEPDPENVKPAAR